MNTVPTPLHLIILAGGGGTRAREGAHVPPKQFTVAAGRLLMAWSAKALAAHPAATSLVVTCAPEWRGAAPQAPPPSPPPPFPPPRGAPPPPAR
ncbi:2-C-methyl-D-erythritol 4-phosphate cytidylyltransferase, partial [bacterium]|nr:2-C-methyl-D-erythritol 4-phosphate cytidylyltransferase [bacterium]